jgi:putative hydrolase of the HAD superfamily
MRRRRGTAGGRRIDAVFLDLGGVVWQPNVAAIRAALGSAGVKADDDLLDRCAYEGVRAMDSASEEEAADAALRAYAARAGIDRGRLEPALEELRSAFETPPWEPRSVGEVAEGLDELAQTGVAIAIVSNASGTAEANLLDQAICQVGEGPGTCVAAVVDSGAAGVAKPDPAIFHIALEATGASPEHTVHVGDSLRFDVAGALAAGITPLHFDPYGLCESDDHDHVAGLRDVAELVRETR